MKKIIFILSVVSIFTVDIYSQNGPKLRRIEGQGNDGLVLDLAPGMHDSILASPTNVYKYPLYDNNKGPVYVDIYDPSLTPSGEFQIIFNDTAHHVYLNEITSYLTKWMLVHIPTHDTVYGDSILGINNVQDIAIWGIKIRTNPTDDPGTRSFTNNGLLESSMEFSDPTQPWLIGLHDNNLSVGENWICSSMEISPFDGTVFEQDSTHAYEDVLNGTWAPYRFARYSFQSTSTGPYWFPGTPGWDKFQSLSQMKNLASVDIVLTADQSKWTRCPVLEMQEDPSLSLGGAKKLNLRKSSSIDKNGNFSPVGIGSSNNPLDPNYISETGMGWFPGYAINIETGERLNLAFSEDSWYPTFGGTDMKWNPTSDLYSGGNNIWGGKQYIYVFGHNGDKSYASDPVMGTGLKDIPVYDAGQAIHNLLSAAEATSTATSDGYKREVFADAMWVGIPLLNPGYNLLATDVEIRLRVSKNYRRQYIGSTNNTNPKYIFDAGTLAGIDQIHSENNFQLYPNPAMDRITINFTSTTKNVVIEIYDVTGQLIKQIKAENNQPISVSELKNGLYILKINNGRTISAQRFIKQ